jgi:hypothetical protein
MDEARSRLGALVGGTYPAAVVTPTAGTS